MKQLVLILIAFIAAVTFIRAFDGSGSPEGNPVASISVSEEFIEN